MRLVLRSLLRSPSFTIVSLLTLALGIGVNTSMFSLVDALLFRMAPYPDAEAVVELSGVNRRDEQTQFSAQEIEEIRAQAAGFSSLTATTQHAFTLADPGAPAERVLGLLVSDGMTDTFRVQPILGRAFRPEEFTPGRNQVVLISESFWRARFGGDPSVVGRTMRVDAEPVTIVGIMPVQFDYPMYWGNVEIWRPLNYTADQLNFRGYRQFRLVGRLQAGVGSAAIAAQLAPLAARQEKEHPEDYPGLQYRVQPLHVAAMDNVSRSISWMLLGLSGFVLLIACANLANLQLARATSSVRDFAIRAALGASRSRLIRQQLAECIVLSLLGGVLGVILALWLNSLLENSILIAGQPGFRLSMDGGVLLATGLVSLATGVVFGVAPAIFASRTDVMTTLKSQARGSTIGRSQNRMRHALIIGEVSLALILLGGAAIMNRGFARMLERPPGWDTSKVLTASLSIPEARYPIGEERRGFFERLEERMAAIPGVERAALATSLPLFRYTADRQVFIDAPGAEGRADIPVASHVMITPDYFATMGIPLIAGRSFPRELKYDGPQYVLVNETLARQFWPNQSALGRRLGSVDNGETVWYEVIGVVRDVEAAISIVEPDVRLHVYRPLVQEPWSYVNIVLRSENPAALADSLRRVVSEIDGDLAPDAVLTVRQFADQTQHNLVIVGNLLIGFAALGLTLAAVGLYGVMSHLVAQRTPEFGIRLALGARAADILGHVLSRGFRLVAIGLAIGLVGAFALGRFLSSVVPRLATADPLGLTLVCLLLLAVALLAAWIPARRATKVDPLVALRAE